MKKIGIILICSAITMFLFYAIYNQFDNKKELELIDNYIEETKINMSETVETNEIVETIKKEERQTKINYTAILEIPSINLKQGVVNSTKNFNSINYAVSVDKNSNYPDELGNFILYAHSGNSNIAYFKKLNKVNINDSVYVYYNGIRYEYLIYDKYDIRKTGKAKIINRKDNKYITLITCNQDKKGYQKILIGKIIKNVEY